MNTFLFSQRRGFRAFLALTVVAAFVLVLPGCGKKSQVLSGKVLTADGKPVTGGDVKFYPAGTAEKGKEGPFMCRLTATGEYTITNLAPGEYKVTVDTDSIKNMSQTPPGAPAGMKPPPGMEAKVNPADLKAPGGLTFVAVPESVKKPESTPLKVTVKGGKETQEIKLPSS